MTAFPGPKERPASYLQRHTHLSSKGTRTQRPGDATNRVAVPSRHSPCGHSDRHKPCGPSATDMPQVDRSIRHHHGVKPPNLLENITPIWRTSTDKTPVGVGTRLIGKPCASGSRYNGLRLRRRPPNVVLCKPHIFCTPVA